MYWCYFLLFSLCNDRERCVHFLNVFCIIDVILCIFQKINYTIYFFIRFCNNFKLAKLNYWFIWEWLYHFSKYFGTNCHMPHVLIRTRSTNIACTLYRIIMSYFGSCLSKVQITFIGILYFGSKSVQSKQILLC